MNTFFIFDPENSELNFFSTKERAEAWLSEYLENTEVRRVYGQDVTIVEGRERGWHAEYKGFIDD